MTRRRSPWHDVSRKAHSKERQSDGLDLTGVDSIELNVYEGTELSSSVSSHHNNASNSPGAMDFISDKFSLEAWRERGSSSSVS